MCSRVVEVCVHIYVLWCFFLASQLCSIRFLWCLFVDRSRLRQQKLTSCVNGLFDSKFGVFACSYIQWSQCPHTRHCQHTPYTGTKRGHTFVSSSNGKNNFKVYSSSQQRCRSWRLFFKSTAMSQLTWRIDFGRQVRPPPSLTHALKINHVFLVFSRTHLLCTSALGLTNHLNTCSTRQVVKSWKRDKKYVCFFAVRCQFWLNALSESWWLFCGYNCRIRTNYLDTNCVCRNACVWGHALTIVEPTTHFWETRKESLKPWLNSKRSINLTHGALREIQVSLHFCFISMISSSSMISIFVSLTKSATYCFRSSPHWFDCFCMLVQEKIWHTRCRQVVHTFVLVAHFFVHFVYMFIHVVYLFVHAVYIFVRIAYIFVQIVDLFVQVAYIFV